MAERFWEKVDRSGDGCWEWKAGRNTDGYGRFRGRDESLYAHRVAYELTFGPIAAGLEVCHHCDNPPCCNPAHFFLGTTADNQADKTRKGRIVNPMTDANRAKTHCPKGHPYDATNTMQRDYKDGSRARACRTCLREWRRRWQARRKRVA